MLPNLVIASLIALVGLLAARWIPRVVLRGLLRATRNEPVSRLIASLCRVAVIAVGALWALTVLHLDKGVTAMLAGVGVVGLAIGFAFQDIAANFMSGFMMAVSQPFKVGDIVELAGRQSRVIRIDLRATEVETLDGLSIVIPNKEVFQNAIVNYTRTKHRRMELEIGSAYCDDLATVRRVVTEAVQQIPHRDHARAIELFFESFGDSAITSRVRVWLEDSSQLAYVEARSEAMIAIKRAFDAHHITIPFPIRTLDFGAKVVGGARLDEMKLAVAG